jgi:hypothetical protein
MLALERLINNAVTSADVKMNYTTREAILEG